MTTVVILFLKSYWKQLIGGLLLAILLYTGYHKIYTIGYDAANIECVERMKDYQDKLDARIKNIEDNSVALIAGANADKLVITQGLNELKLNIKNKPLYTIVEGKCKPTDLLIDTLNNGIDKANGK